MWTGEKRFGLTTNDPVNRKGLGFRFRQASGNFDRMGMAALFFAAMRPFRQHAIQFFHHECNRPVQIVRAFGDDKVGAAQLNDRFRGVVLLARVETGILEIQSDPDNMPVVPQQFLQFVIDVFQRAIAEDVSGD